VFKLPVQGGCPAKPAMSTVDKNTVLTALAGMAAGAVAFAYLSKKDPLQPAPADNHAQANGRTTSPPAEATTSSPTHELGTSLKTDETRSRTSGTRGKNHKPVVLCTSPDLEPLAKSLRKRVGDKEYTEEQGKTVYVDRFKSEDINAKFNWERVNGRKVVMLFDTVDQGRFFEQLCLLQALQGFAIPEPEDKGTKWKTYVDSGKYSWGRAASITVVLPWFRPCQMERTSRWQLTDGSTGKWTNGDPEGEWLDVPSAQYYARLLSTPGSVPPLPGPSGALDNMPIQPLWRPPLELLFVELHEEKPVGHSVSDLNTDVRMIRYVPYFLDKYKAKRAYPGPAHMYVLFPDHGAHDRYAQSVKDVLKLDRDHILFIQKSRVGEAIEQVQKLFYEDKGGGQGERQEFTKEDSILIIDDFTNSGSTLFGAVELIKSKVTGGGTPPVHIFVSHLVAGYDKEVVEKLRTKLHGLGDQCRLFVTNSIPSSTDLLKDDPQVEVCDLSDFIADAITTRR